MAKLNNFPVVTEGLLNALQDHLPNKLPPPKKDNEVYQPHEISFLHGQQSVINLLRQVHLKQEIAKTKPTKSKG